jgi:hypothetical protein
MKKIILFCITILFFSCSDSDLSPSIPPTDANMAKYPSTITYNNGNWTSTFNLSYDLNHRLGQIIERRDSSNPENIFTLTYDSSDRLVLIDRLGQEHHTIAFTYNDFGHVSSWKYDNMEPRTVTYQNGIYTVAVANIQIFHSFDAMNDITMVNSGSETTLTYDATKKGAFKNVVGNYELFSLYLDACLIDFGCRKALLSITSSSRDSTFFTNTYDSEGYITSFTGVSGTGHYPWATITYTE